MVGKNEEQGCSVASLLLSHLAHCCASQVRRRGEKTRSNRRIQLKPFPSFPVFPFSPSCCSNSLASVSKEKQKVGQAAFIAQNIMLRGKTSRTDRRILEIGAHLEAVCLTDLADLQAKTYSTAPVLTRELPKGMKIVSKYSLGLI